MISYLEHQEVGVFFTPVLLHASALHRLFIPVVSLSVRLLVNAIVDWMGAMS